MRTETEGLSDAEQAYAEEEQRRRSDYATSTSSWGHIGTLPKWSTGSGHCEHAEDFPDLDQHPWVCGRMTGRSPNSHGWCPSCPFAMPKEEEAA